MVRVIRIGGKVIYDLETTELTFTSVEEKTLDRLIGHVKRNKQAYASLVYALALLTLPGNVLAAGAMGGGKSIIILMQKAAFWIAIGITIWGVVEMWLEAPNWKGRILKGILGYIIILVIPLIFMELQTNLQADVWQQIEEGTRQAESVTKGVQR